MLRGDEFLSSPPRKAVRFGGTLPDILLKYGQVSLGNGPAEGRRPRRCLQGGWHERPVSPSSPRAAAAAALRGLPLVFAFFVSLLSSVRPLKYGSGTYGFCQKGSKYYLFFFPLLG